MFQLQLLVSAERFHSIIYDWPIKCQCKIPWKGVLLWLPKASLIPRRVCLLGCRIGFKISRNCTCWSRDVWRAQRTCYYFQSILGNVRKDAGGFFQNENFWTVWGKAMEIKKFDSPAIDRTVTFLFYCYLPPPQKMHFLWESQISLVSQANTPHRTNEPFFVKLQKQWKIYDSVGQNPFVLNSCHFSMKKSDTLLVFSYSKHKVIERKQARWKITTVLNYFHLQTL